jgi:hypothetical protein
MMGILKIRNLIENITKEITYYTLLSLDLDAKKDIMKSLYEDYRHKRIELYCCCSSNPIQMSINYITAADSYYLKSYPKQAGNHHQNCHFFNENTLSSNSSYQKNCKEDQQGNLLINLAAHDYKKLNTNASSSEGTTSENEGPGKSVSKLTTSHLIKLIVTKAWNDYIFFNGKEQYPTLQSIFKQTMNITLKKFFIDKNINLYDMSFKGGNTGKIFYIEQSLKNKFYPFVLFKLNDLVDEGEQYSLILEEPQKETIMNFTVNHLLWEEAKRATNVSDGPYLVGGFVKSTGKGLAPEFVSIGLLPINDYGVPIESSFEREAYNLFCSQQRLIQRPIDSKYHPQWNGLIPDGLFIDTAKPTIIEVFGMSESRTEYHLHRQFKIDHFTRLEGKYDLWYWDAFTGSPIPPIPLIKI